MSLTAVILAACQLGFLAWALLRLPALHPVQLWALPWASR